MKAVEIDQFGGADVLRYRDTADPAPGPGQVLIEAHAGSVNPIDWKIREGQMAMRYGEDFPMILGFDVSGVVAAVGEGVTRFAPGEAVWARGDQGAGQCYAELVCVGEGGVAKKPASLSHAGAAALPLVGQTIIGGLRTLADVQPGQRVLIVGASGGVGIHAVQIAKAMGAHVTASASGKNLDFVAEHGADQLIDYTARDVLETDAPYDLIYDTVGTQSVPAARAALTPQGLYLTLVPVPEIEMFFPGKTERKPQGAYFMVWSPRGEDLDLLSGWIEAGQLKPVIDSRYPLAELADAHLRSETLRAKGKIVIEIR